MAEHRTEKISVLLEPDVLQKLDQYAEQHRWTRSSAAAELIERGLRDAPRNEKETGQ